ncbi:hypothetical protein DVH05_020978 [Phytophthora capsici]|nr:hypothetical protein DVH05_020978 [Phytophthora capsici]
MELLMEFVEWCYWALNAGLPLLWHAVRVHWTGLLWALAGALAWMITKPMWGVLGRLCWAVFCFGYKWADIVKASIRRYRRFVSGPSVKGRPPAERRWKMYEALWVTPMVV